ncbi:MAG TPA: hypothetical protein VK573_05905 [Gemmatimonadales bacterium]|nr:hypothetical protein [Gemmatimonadales bacterium]
MTGFAIPRVSVPASLLLTDGNRRPGEIYVMERVPQHSGSETPLEMLNRPEGFFPFRPAGDDATILLVTKAHTITLSVATDDAAQDPARLSAAKLVALELTFVDGSTLQGFATAELPEQHSRLLDYLNASSPFFAVSAGEEFHFVNRAHVLYARPED